MIKFDKRYINKILHTNSFFHFSDLKQYIPLLQSIDEFLGDKWLNIFNRTFYAKVPTSMTRSDLTSQENLDVLKSYFIELEGKIKHGYSRKKWDGKVYRLSY